MEQEAAKIIEHSETPTAYLCGRHWKREREKKQQTDSDWVVSPIPTLASWARMELPAACLLVCLCGLAQAATESPAAASTTAEAIPGHHQPLGQHRPPEVPIDEFNEPITGEVFFNDYIKQQRPVVFRGFAKQWPAFSRWSDETLAKDFGTLEVKIEAKRDGSNNGPAGSLGIGRDTIGNFVATYRAQDKYIVSEMPAPLYSDVLIHPSMGCGELSRSLVEVDLWLSSGGTRSRLHRDAYNAVNCVLSGTKHWMMIDNNQTDNVYFVADGRYEMGGLSPVDVDDVDLEEFPRFRDVKYGQVDINAGDCIFIPGGHYHQVKSTGDRNLAVSVLFGRVNEFSAAECKDVPLVAKPLDQFDVLWRWRGTGIMDMGRGDDYFFKLLFTNRMPGNETEITLKGIAAMLVKDMSMEPDRTTAKMAKDILSLLDHDKDGVLSVQDMNSVDRHVYRNLSFLIEGDSDLMNTYRFEYGILDYYTVREVLDDLLLQNRPKKAVSKADFMSAYTSDPIRGSPFNGEKLFKTFDTNGDGSIQANEVSTRILDAKLRPYELHYEGEGGREEEAEQEQQEEGDDDSDANEDEEEDGRNENSEDDQDDEDGEGSEGDSEGNGNDDEEEGREDDEDGTSSSRHEEL